MYLCNPLINGLISKHSFGGTITHHMLILQLCMCMNYTIL